MNSLHPPASPLAKAACCIHFSLRSKVERINHTIFTIRSSRPHTYLHIDDEEMMMSSGDDIPSTIVCHFYELEHAENDEDVMMDVLDLDFSTSNRSALNDSRHFIDDISGATEARNDHVSDEELCAMKDMVASMRRNPELLNQSPVMQRACLTSSSSLHRLTSDKPSPDETTDVKNEDLCAMKDMIASMRKDPRLLYQSPVMQKACFTITNTTASGPSLISPHVNTPTLDQVNNLNTSSRRPLGTKFDPTRIPSLPLAQGASIDKNVVKGPLPPATFSSLPLPSVARCASMDKKPEKAPSSQASVMKMDKKVQPPKRPRSV